MNRDHKAIIDRANREGILPMELASELLVHDLVEASLRAIRGHQVPFSKLTQQQQDDAIQGIADDVTKAVDTAIRVIAGAGSRTIRMKLGPVAAGPTCKITGTTSSDEEHIHELFDKSFEKADVLIVLHERDYLQGLDSIKGEEDQKPLPLDTKAEETPAEKPAKAKTGKPAKEARPVQVTAEQVAQGRDFVQRFGNGTVAGMQNQLKVGIEKALAVMAALEADGYLSAPIDEEGNRNALKRQDPSPVTETDAAAETFENITSEAPTAGDLYEEAHALVVGTRKVSVSYISRSLNVDDETAEKLIAELEKNGVVSEENEMGGRAVLAPAK